MSGRLLVVDWDAFFPNPTLMPGSHFADTLMFDWAHAETPFLQGPVWYGRAASFLAAGRDLPMCRDYDRFWDGRPLAPVAMAVAADSNAVAANVLPVTYGIPGRGWDQVWLVDAHHDSGYRDDYATLTARTTVTCEDWMLRHHHLGATLHVRYPPWRADQAGVLYDTEPAPLCPVDRAVGFTDLPTVFDAVMVCRSGAWVPPWCDQQFADFLARVAPAAPWLGDGPMVREFDVAAATAEAKSLANVLEQIRRMPPPLLAADAPSP